VGRDANLGLILILVVDDDSGEGLVMRGCLLIIHVLHAISLLNESHVLNVPLKNPPSFI
jgi:hypothetical protein